MINFVFFGTVRLVWKTGSRFVQYFKKVNGYDYSKLFSTLLWNYTNRCDIGITNKSCFGQIFAIPKIGKTREIVDIQKVFESTAVFDEIFQFFLRPKNESRPPYSVNVPVPHTTQCIRDEYIPQFKLLVSHRTDTHIVNLCLTGDCSGQDKVRTKQCHSFVISCTT